MKAKGKIRLIERRLRQRNLSGAAIRIHTKLRNEPICHFGEVPANEPLACFSWPSHRSNKPIFTIINRRLRQLCLLLQKHQPRPNPSESDQIPPEIEFLFLTPATQTRTADCRDRTNPFAPAPHHFHQNLTGQTGLLLRLYGPV